MTFQANNTQNRKKKNISTKPCGCNYSSCLGRTNGNPYMHIFLGSWSYTHNFYYIELTLSFAWMTQFITSTFINEVMVSQLFFSYTINISIFPIIICFLLHERISRFICMNIYTQLQEKNHITSLTTQSYKYPYKAGQVLAIKRYQTMPHKF